MVYKLKNWFVFETGDWVLVLPSGRKGIVTAVNKLDYDQKSQELTVKTHNKEKNYNSNVLELLKPIATQR